MLIHGQNSLTMAQVDHPSATAVPDRSLDRKLPLEQTQHHASSSTKCSKSAGRVLEDYTLSVTLGVGSSGKVKLATHNVTGERVRSVISRIYLMNN